MEETCKEDKDASRGLNPQAPLPLFLTLISHLTTGTGWDTLKVRLVLIKGFQPHSKCDEKGTETAETSWVSRYQGRFSGRVTPAEISFSNHPALTCSDVPVSLHLSAPSKITDMTLQWAGSQYSPTWVPGLAPPLGGWVISGQMPSMPSLRFID